MDIIHHCNQLLKLLDEEYPNQKSYPGVIKDIYNSTINVLQAAKNNQQNKPIYNSKSLSRMFVDDTTHFQSPVLKEIEKISQLVDEHWKG